MMGGKHSVVTTFVDDGTDQSWRCHGKLHHVLQYKIDYGFRLKNQLKSPMNDYHAILW